MPASPGAKLGHYEVVEAIGAGGMGEVYRARDTKLERDVAIKVLPEELSRDKEPLDRFQREAKSPTRLTQPSSCSSKDGSKSSSGSSRWMPSRI